LTFNLQSAICNLKAEKIVSHERELQVALAAVELTRQPILDQYRRFTPVPGAAADIKLSIDRDTQELLLGELSRAFPDDSFCAEEETPTLARLQRKSPGGERLWIIDPIDGTRGFAQKNGEFSVMVGLVQAEEIVVGVVFEPVRERLTYAVRGGGCWQRDGSGAAVRCRVNPTADLGQAVLTQSRSSSGKRSRHAEALGAARFLYVYSAGIKLAQVARGDADMYLNTYPNFHDWDICAGHLLVTEAGGRVTTLKGEELRYGRPGAGQRGGLLASNGILHDAALNALNA
jgi:3'(2'), 5'-bisphosphate nucleotidase